MLGDGVTSALTSPGTKPSVWDSGTGWRSLLWREIHKSRKGEREPRVKVMAVSGQTLRPSPLSQCQGGRDFLCILCLLLHFQAMSGMESREARGAGKGRVGLGTGTGLGSVSQLSRDGQRDVMGGLDPPKWCDPLKPLLHPFMHTQILPQHHQSSSRTRTESP